jgi:hypothetical protein
LINTKAMLLTLLPSKIACTVLSRWLADGSIVLVGVYTDVHSF